MSSLAAQLRLTNQPRQESRSASRQRKYGRGPLLITTNKDIKDWPQPLAGDQVLAAAILDRLLQHSHVLKVKSRSCRLRDLEQATNLQR